MKEKFENWRPSEDSKIIVAWAHRILENYAQDGYTLSLRQLYYQFVSKDLIPNTERSYKNLGNTINRARTAGLLDWSYIEDRGRNRQANAHWENPQSGIDSLLNQYQIDKWENQEYYIEVWVEKEALIEVVANACKPLDVSYFACKGYGSQSELYSAGKRLEVQSKQGRTPILLHLGDHDPSGIDMTCDNEKRLSLFAREQIKVVRLALNMDQIEQYAPPPNPTKITDSRAKKYISQFGHSSWELDALEPRVIERLVADNIMLYRDDDLWSDALEKEDQDKEKLREAAWLMENGRI